LPFIALNPLVAKRSETDFENPQRLEFDSFRWNRNNPLKRIFKTSYPPGKTLGTQAVESGHSLASTGFGSCAELSYR
jgi:hypothetical protein